MKVKFYSMALLASMAISANAADFAPVKLDASACKLVTIDNPLLKKYEGESKNKGLKAPATAKDLTGDYVVTYTNLLNATENDPGAYTGAAYIDEGDDANQFLISFPFLIQGNEAELALPVTVSGNVITISKATVSVGGESINFGAFETYVEDNALKVREIESIEAVFTGCGFTFANPSHLIGVGDTEMRFYFLAKLANFQKPDVPDSEMNLGWKSLGNATFQDGWIMSGMTGGEQGNPDYMWEVELQQNEDDANIYRIVNPYGENSPVVDYNSTANMNGFIQFNVSDPDHVIFDVVPSNFSNPDMDIEGTYMMNTATLLVYYYGWTMEEAIEYYGNKLLWTSYKDGVLTLPSQKGDKGYVNDAVFGVSANPFGGYSWQDQNRLTTNMEAKIIFPDVNAIEGVEIDNSNAPVKYFNLQGVEIENPENGQLVIKRQGTKAEKIIVR